MIRVSKLRVVWSLAMTVSGVSAGRARAAETPVTVTDAGCEPAALTVSAGVSTFVILNKSARLLEWEILNGVMVVDERENIAPGFRQKLTTKLDPGTYAMTCGLVDNPKGTLTVTAGGAASAAKPSPMDFVGPDAEYRNFVLEAVEQMAADAGRLSMAVKTGDLDKARSFFIRFRMNDARLAPVEGLLGVDAAGSPGRPASEGSDASTSDGIENALFVQNATQGTAPLVDALLAKAMGMQTRAAALVIPTKSMVRGAAELIRTKAKAVDGETRSDRLKSLRADLRGNIEGVKKITDLLGPLATKADPAIKAKIDADLAAADGVLAPRGTNEVTLSDPTTPFGRALSAPLNQIAKDLDDLSNALGLS
jgi:iron uptake system component EfeO